MTTLIQRLSLSSSEDSPETGFAAATIAEPGTRIFQAIVLPLDAEGRTVNPGDVQGQVRFCVSQLDALLREAGGGMVDLSAVTLSVAEGMSVDLTVAADAFADECGEQAPTLALLGVRVLRADGQVVELSATAALRGR